jgi:Ca-activated chloride channel family protein
MTMLEFGSFVLANPWALLGLIAVPALGYWLWRHRSDETLGFSFVSQFDAYRPTLKTRLRGLPTMVRMLAVVVLIVGVARPQWAEFEEESVEGIDIMLALDMSASMSAVDQEMRDILRYQRAMGENPPSRFDHAIRTLKEFVDERTRDRIGMVVFAQEAYVQFPLTLDYSTIQSLLDRLELESIPPGATAIGNALGLATRGLIDSPTESKAIILITDGKQQGGNISPLQAAEIAADHGIQIYPILVGTGGDTLVPRRGANPEGIAQYRPERYPIDPELLEEIAQMTDADYYRANRPRELKEGLQQILNELETTQLQDISSTKRTELYPWFGLAGLLLLLLASLFETLWLRRIV